jgi:transposase
MWSATRAWCGAIPRPVATAHVHGWVQREWRHLDTCQFETRIVAEVPRLKYKSGRVEDATVPWAERYSRITVMMEAFVVRLLQAASNVSRVARLINLDWHTVNGVIARAVRRGLARRAQEPVRHLG